MISTGSNLRAGNPNAQLPQGSTSTATEVASVCKEIHKMVIDSNLPYKLVCKLPFRVFLSPSSPRAYKATPQGANKDFTEREAISVGALEM
jgi:hypothetical protein